MYCGNISAVLKQQQSQYRILPINPWQTDYWRQTAFDLSSLAFLFILLQCLPMVACFFMR